MSKIKIGDKIAFRHECSVSDDGYVEFIKRIYNWIMFPTNGDMILKVEEIKE